MKQYICLLIVVMIVLFAYNLLKQSSLIEPLENKDGSDNCDNIKTQVYKNAGNVGSLQDKINQLMDQVNKLILSNDKQNSSIQQLQTKEEQNRKVGTQADNLANDNKGRLVALAKQSKAQVNAGTAASDNQPSP